MKPLPTAPNAEAKAARVPRDTSPMQQSGSRKHSTSSQQAALGQHPSLRQLSSSTQPASPGQHPASRQSISTAQTASSVQYAGSRKQSISDQEPKPAQHISPVQHYSPTQNDVIRRRVSSKDWNSSVQEESPNVRNPSRDWSQVSTASPLIEHAMSAKKGSPVMRMHSTERIKLAKTPEPHMPVSNPERKPLIPERGSSRRQSHVDHRRSMSVEQPLTNGEKDQEVVEEAKNESGRRLKEDDSPSGTDLPIQSPTELDPPPPTTSPPIIKRVPSRRITIMSTTSEYSGRSDSPVTREVSPELHRNSKGFVPNHRSYGSISFLPMHPLLSPLPDPSDSWADDAEREFEKRTSDPPRASSPAQRVPSPQPIPAPDDSEGAVNTSHPLLLAERHTKFSSRITPASSRNGRDLPLRHYRSQEVVRQSIFSPSDEKEVFVPPKRSSSLVYSQNDRAFSAVANSSASLPLATTLSPPPHASSAAPSPLNVTQTQRSLTPQPTNVLKSSKASIVMGPSSEDSLSTSSAPSDGATPPAISRSRSPGISHSKSTPILPTTKSVLDPSESEDTISDGKMPLSTTNNTPVYLNPISSAALIDFLASTPPPTPPGRRPRSPFHQIIRDNDGPTKEHSGSFSIFPSSPAPPSPGGRAMTSLINPRVGPKGVPPPIVAAASPVENKKGFKKFFGGVGTRKAKNGKAPRTEGLALVIPEHDRYRTKKRSGKKGEKGEKSEKSESAGAIEGKKEGEGEGSGFMGVGRDGVWISRKNFLKT